MGSCQLPYLFDEGAGKKIAGGDSVVDYLWENYSPPGSYKPLMYYIPIANEALLWLSTHLRLGLRKTGAMQTPSRFPQDGKPLQLWSCEPCPHCRLVRETLSTLEIPYVLYNSAKGSKKLQALRARVDINVKLPYLEDSNSDFLASGSSEIISHLKKTYQIAFIRNGGRNKVQTGEGGGSESKLSS
jgi:glutaredoxin